TDKKGLLLAEPDDPKLCVGCHGELMKEETKGSSHPLFKDGKCLTCHDSHGSNITGMLVNGQGPLCFSCHESGLKKDTPVVQSEHPTFTSGGCTKCHSPHKAKLKKLLLSGMPDLCISCHKLLKEKMNWNVECDKLRAVGETDDNAAALKACNEVSIYVHAPSALQTCLRCHKPHLSSEAGLISQPLQILCAECHDYKTESFSKAHIYIAADVMDCNKCHDPHTSKGQKFFKDVIHKPFNVESCGECHLTGKP
ncbi:MAG: cytochrome c3 family protein, partial [Nitrospirota bacterium]